jgi:hypothetical protein
LKGIIFIWFLAINNDKFAVNINDSSVVRQSNLIDLSYFIKVCIIFNFACGILLFLFFGKIQILVLLRSYIFLVFLLIISFWLRLCIIRSYSVIIRMIILAFILILGFVSQHLIFNLIIRLQAFSRVQIFIIFITFRWASFQILFYFRLYICNLTAFTILIRHKLQNISIHFRWVTINFKKIIN